MHTSIRGTSVTLQEYLLNGFRADQDLSAPFSGNMQVSLNTPEEMKEARLQGLSLWLYRVMRDDTVLNQPPVRSSDTSMIPTPLPLRLHYLITPIVNVLEADPGSSPESEQTILGKAMQLLHVKPVLQGSDLKNSLIGTSTQITTRLEPLGTEEITRIWAALKASYQLSVSYESAIVYITADTAERVAPVRVAQPKYSVITGQQPT
ncbi:MAG: DUF4255 domain-containing protein [Gemmatimonas sp.]